MTGNLKYEPILTNLTLKLAKMEKANLALGLDQLLSVWTFTEP